MRPANLATRIFLDGGDEKETADVLSALGFIDGQTTNPSLIARNPAVAARLARGEKFAERELLSLYRDVVRTIASFIPDGSVSVEVYADIETSAEDMLAQAREMFAWVPNAHVKLPITFAGLAVAETLVKEGVRVNMTLCFSQAQAAAVYAATRGARKGQVLISPFVGRLDDKGLDGMRLVENILRMYAKGDGHVETLAASIRHRDHLEAALGLRTDIVTAPAKVLKEWAAAGKPVPERPAGPSPALRDIPYEDHDLMADWKEFDIGHELTAAGIAKFADDWNALLR